MKKNSKFSFAFISLFLALSCNNAAEKKEEPVISSADTAASAPVPAAPAKPANLAILKHKVADFAKWLPLFESHDTARLRFGLHNFMIGRGVKDSNMVLVALWMDDFEKAKAFTELPDLKAAMQKGGVIGKPEISFMDMQMLDSGKLETPFRMMVTHQVKDYAAWKASFDSHKQVRIDANMTDRAIGYEMGNNKKVTVVTAVNDMAKAEAFSTSKELKDRMQEAGVEGPPTIFFYRMAKKY